MKVSISNAEKTAIIALAGKLTANELTPAPTLKEVKRLAKECLAEFREGTTMLPDITYEEGVLATLCYLFPGTFRIKEPGFGGYPLPEEPEE